MSAIIISSVAIGFFLLTLMLGKRHKLAADKFLIVYFLFFITSQLYFYFEALGFFETSAFMLLGKGVYLLGGPLFFYYVYTLTTSRAITVKLYAVTLIPVLLYGLHFLYYWLVGFDGKIIRIDNGLLYINNQLSWSWSFFTLLLIVSDPLYLVWYYHLLRQYRQKAANSLSNVERTNLQWLNKLFYLSAASAVVLLPMLVFSIGRQWFSSAPVALLLQLNYAVFIFLLGYFGFRQTTLFTDTSTEVKELAEVSQGVPRYERSGLSSEQASLYRDKLQQWMTERKPYLDGELTAHDLSRQLGISANHLSQVINQIEGKNFFDFINAYRIAEVKRKMAAPDFKNLTLLAIALESGFNSKTSFNTVFKKTVGQTPSQYYKSMVRVNQLVKTKE